MLSCSFRKYLPHRKGKKKVEADAIFSPGAAGVITACREGSLDSEQQLRKAYANLMQDDGFKEAWRKEFFQKIRILVIGRSGAGKTTLIRLMVGKEGPQTITDGVAGVQDINKEFEYFSEEEGIPLKIHDSNGMDVKGKERVDEIASFLNKHQKGDDFTNHVHIIWYIISAIDPRCVEDGDVMKLIGKFKIPLLLILTHNDYPKDKLKVKDNNLNKLLEGYGNEKDRETVKNMMVRVSNDGITSGINNELIIDETKRDTEGLKLVAKMTHNLIDKRLRYTWVAAQAVDMDGKLEESAGIIAGYARRALLTSLPRVIPFADPLKLSIIFYRVLLIMCQIWVVPKALKEALKDTLLMKEGGARVLQEVGKDMVFAMGLAAAVGATVVTAGIALPSVIVVLAVSGVLRIGTAVPILVRTFSLQVLATILYVKSTQMVTGKQCRWDPTFTKEDYVKLCEDFAHNDEYQKLCENFAREDQLTMDIALRKKKVKGIIKSKILLIFHRLLRDRPNSLFSLLRAPLQDDTWTDSTFESDISPVLSMGKSIANEEYDEGKKYDELDNVD